MKSKWLDDWLIVQVALAPGVNAAKANEKGLKKRLKYARAIVTGLVVSGSSHSFRGR